MYTIEMFLLEAGYSYSEAQEIIVELLEDNGAD